MGHWEDWLGSPMSWENLFSLLLKLSNHVWNDSISTIFHFWSLRVRLISAALVLLPHHSSLFPRNLFAMSRMSSTLDPSFLSESSVDSKLNKKSLAIPLFVPLVADWTLSHADRISKCDVLARSSCRIVWFQLFNFVIVLDLLTNHRLAVQFLFILTMESTSFQALLTTLSLTHRDQLRFGCLGVAVWVLSGEWSVLVTVRTKSNPRFLILSLWVSGK